METARDQLETFVEARDITPNGRLRTKSSHHPAFVFYYPRDGKDRGRIFYNEEAWRILSLKVPPLKKGGGSPSNISSLCSKWKGLLDKTINQQSGSAQKGAAAPKFIETIQSYRRQYLVKGIILLEAPLDTRKKERSYLFVMERTEHESVNLLKAARQLNLNRREQEIVRLLVKGLGNKEIAFALGLSLNTVKGYMKLLMGRLRVRNRVGIISILLTQSPDSIDSVQPLPQLPQFTLPPLTSP
jgi:DNA-binding CsgD family transcriptional regulator